MDHHPGPGRPHPQGSGFLTTLRDARDFTADDSGTSRRTSGGAVREAEVALVATTHRRGTAASPASGGNDAQHAPTGLTEEEELEQVHSLRWLMLDMDLLPLLLGVLGLGVGFGFKGGGGAHVAKGYITSVRSFEPYA